MYYLNTKFSNRIKWICNKCDKEMTSFSIKSSYNSIRKIQKLWLFYLKKKDLQMVKIQEKNFNLSNIWKNTNKRLMRLHIFKSC